MVSVRIEMNTSKYFDLPRKVISVETINEDLKDLKDVDEEKVSNRAKEIEKKINQGNEKKLKNIFYLNTDDNQSLGQPSITFLRQVMALVTYPALMNCSEFPDDAKNRAKDFLDDFIGKSIGSYSDVGGMGIVRRQIAKFIEEVDNVDCQWENCYVGQGTEDMVNVFLTLLKLEDNTPKIGVLNPIPGYSIYSSIISQLGILRIDYSLDEQKQWKICTKELRESIVQVGNVCKPRAIIVINPGNPTSQILTRANMEEIVRFAFTEKLIIIADEVYRSNILKGDFIPFRNVLRDMGQPYSEMELVTLMSMSDGLYSENGIRCGFAEMKNFKLEIQPMIYRLLSITPPPNTSAQAALYCIVNQPKPEEPSFELFEYEKKAIMRGFQKSARIVEKSIRNTEGLVCNSLEGGIFSFPRLILPEASIREAKKMELTPDQFYALQLLEETGICVMPGNETGQKPGTHHIRMTLISDPTKQADIMQRFQEFHLKFIKKYLL